MSGSLMPRPSSFSIDNLLTQANSARLIHDPAQSDDWAWKAWARTESFKRTTYLHLRGAAGNVDIDRSVPVLISKVMEKLPQRWNKCNHRACHNTNARSVYHIDTAPRDVADWNDWLAVCYLGTHSSTPVPNERSKGYQWRPAYRKC
ncbi:hypothetical protein J7337_006227 [Fusarium musae]|uniref:Uncharacterized protein n=1 Tax=Fusarium musae TaxID=1042133 RepID=A0A9P8DKG0_9HYPO|nr:hypothetical protein J7337_006227 [Fusarium musae]KAG9503382.1 hypothetical protein J7337_006227 [Fusarium musae]